MDFRDNHALKELLAAEYVLGTLRSGARRRFETMLRHDRSLQHHVDVWSEHLAPFSELIPEVAPPARVWQGIVQRVPVLQSGSKTHSGFWHSLALWRGLSLAMTLVVALLLGVTMTRHVTPGNVTVASATTYVATFAAPDTKAPVAVLMIPDHGNEVILKVVDTHLDIPKDKSLQLWLIKPGTQNMVSAGVAPHDDGTGAIHFSVPNAQDLRGAKTLGLSLEPLGGSPQPTQALGFGQWSKVST